MASIKRWEVSKWLRAIREHGPGGALFRWWHYGAEVKVGRLVGRDSLGNRYYENAETEQILGRDRWVDYARVQYPQEPSQIAPEWHAWMHRMTDQPPGSAGDKYFTPRASYQVPVHYENRTGTEQAYRPYNTTRSKIESWQPSVRPR